MVDDAARLGRGRHHWRRGGVGAVCDRVLGRQFSRGARAVGRVVRRKQIQQDLHDWARWQESQTGYSSQTVIARWLANELGNQGGAALPLGIEPEAAYLRRLVHAMRLLSGDPKKARYIKAVQLRYLIGPRQAERLLDRPSRTIRRWCRRGETLLEKQLQIR